MSNKTNNILDTLKIAENKKIMKQLDEGEVVWMSAKVVKINHVNKRQERTLLVTNKGLYNIASPTSIMPNRIKRRIPFGEIIGISTSRFGNEVVVHIDKQDDYRFFSANMKNKYLEAIVECIGITLKKAVALFYYDDLSLQNYTTTIVDLQKKKRKPFQTDPVYVDIDSIKKVNLSKPESKLIFRSQNSDNINAFEQFEIIKVLGRGAFGKVMLCKNKNLNTYFAVKSMRKEDLIEKDSVERTITEKTLLQKVNHPFLVSLEYAFQTKQKIFLVMKYYKGGEMFTKIRREKRFSEKRAKFYAAQVYLALKHLHDLGYVYRDLKPENILFDQNGYIRVSDYGLAKQLSKNEQTYSITGTPSYLSPEVIMSQGHSFPVDWWAFGVLIYEMLFSNPPFYHKQHKEIFKLIVGKELSFPPDIDVSLECKNLLKGLLSKYPHKRLGTYRQQDIQEHPWFKDFDWQALLDFQIKPEYIPEVNSEEDVSNFHTMFTKEAPVDTLVNSDGHLLDLHQKQFEGFNFNRFNQLTKVNSQNPELQSDFHQTGSRSNLMKKKK